MCSSQIKDDDDDDDDDAGTSIIIISHYRRRRRRRCCGSSKRTFGDLAKLLRQCAGRTNCFRSSRSSEFDFDAAAIHDILNEYQ